MVGEQVTAEGHPLPINVHEYQEKAQAVLSPMAYGYFAGGAGDEVTLRANRQAFDQWRLLPRVLRGAEEIRLETSVLSQPISMPLLLDPIGLQRLGHVEGEIASARAARSAGTIFTLSTGASATIEDVAASTGKWWFQLYVNRDRGVTCDLVQRAEAAGAGALVVTVDMPALGRRAVVDAVEGRGEVLMDGGIRRGTDVVKALALGARAVLAGRPFLWGLAVGGEAGVAHVLELLGAEITLAMTLCGCAGVEEVSRSLLVGVGPVAGRPPAYASDGRTTI